VDSEGSEREAEQEPVDATGELLRRGREGGDPASFSLLYARVAPALRAWVALRMGQSLRKRFDPDDVVQETCLRAHRDLARYDPQRGSFRAWLLGFAQRVLLECASDVARGKPRGALLPTADALQELPEEATTITRVVARDEVQVRLRAELEALGPEERKLLVHRGLEERTHAEVAALLGLDEGTVRKRWQRTLERVRSMPGFQALDLHESR
jgi:RNA polymerase sigma-70 factor (ECF subfamily)